MKNLSEVINNEIKRSELINDIIKFVDNRQDVTINLENHNIQDSTVINQVTVSLSKSLEYNELITKQKELENSFNAIPEDNQAKRLELSAWITHQKEVIKKYVEDVLNLAQQFRQITIDSSRLQRAREYFNNGRIREARAIYEVEMEEMIDENDRLINEKEHFEKEILPKLKQSSEDLFLSALLAQTDYKNPKPFTKIADCYLRSIKAFRNKNNIFGYANFLQRYNQYEEAEKYLQECLEDYSKELESWEKAALLNNLGTIQLDSYKPESALASYTQALEIWRTLAEENSDDYLPDLIASLNSLGELHDNLGNFDLALEAYQEALDICRKSTLSKPSNYLSDEIATLTNFGNLYKNYQLYDEAILKYQEALEILNKLDKETFPTYLSDQAILFNNLAASFFFKDQIPEALAFDKAALEIRKGLAANEPLRFLPDTAQSYYNLGEVETRAGLLNEAFLSLNKALEIYSLLAEKSPQVYSPKVAMVLKFLALIYQKVLPDFDKSVNCALAAIKIMLPIYQSSAEIQSNLERALDILKDWGYSDTEIQNLITGKE